MYSGTPWLEGNSVCITYDSDQRSAFSGGGGMTKFDDRAVGDRSRAVARPLLPSRGRAYSLQASKQKAFIDLSLRNGSRIGTLVLDVYDSDAPKGSSALLHLLASASLVHGTLASLTPESHLELQRSQGSRSRAYPLSFEADGAAPPSHDQRGIVSVNAHDDRVAILFDSSHGALEHNWRACGCVSEGLGVLEAIRKLGDEERTLLTVESCGVLNGLSTDGAALTAARERARRAAAEAEAEERRARDGLTEVSREVQAKRKRVRSKVKSAVSSALASSEKKAKSAHLGQSSATKPSFMDPLTEYGSEDENDDNLRE